MNLERAFGVAQKPLIQQLRTALPLQPQAASQRAQDLIMDIPSRTPTSVGSSAKGTSAESAQVRYDQSQYAFSAYPEC